MEASFIKQYNDKTQYRSTDPNNTFWAKDQSRFGLKMLKNMGWSEGNGLGANEDGTVSHVVVKKKFSNSGIGEQNNSSDAWLKGAFDYGNLLKRLNTDQDGEEVKPKKDKKDKKDKNNSKKRHLYQKRLASRDASGYSKQDLALILGTDQIKPKVIDEMHDNEEFSESDDEESAFLTTKKVSVTDYFMKKGTYQSSDEDEDVQKETKGSGAPSTGLGFVPAGKKRSRVQAEMPKEEEEPKAKKSKKEKKKEKEKGKEKKSKSAKQKKREKEKKVKKEEKRKSSKKAKK